MKKRNRIVDKKFQLKTTFSIIGIIIITLIALIAMTGLVLTDNNRRINNAIRTVSPAEGGQTKDKALQSAATAETVTLLRELIRRNKIIITVMIIVTVLLGIALYYYLINLTNRISGPIYVLSKHMSDILEGREPDLRELRKNDELKEFYEQFSALARRIKRK